MAFELEELTPRCRVAKGPVNVGIVDSGEGMVTLVDSGNDEEAGRKLVRACDALDRRIAHIANTHSNADHCGGNEYIQARAGCEIWATRAEAAFIETPVLEPSYLWGGFPLPALRNKFLMAKPSRVTRLFDPPCSLAGTGLDAIALPGHFMAMAGFMTEEKVFFAADSIASIEILDKYHIFYLFDIEAQLATLEALPLLDADWFVPSHAGPTRDILPLAKANRMKIDEVAAVVLDCCREPISPDGLISRTAKRFGIALNHQQYVLVGSTVRSYAAWLVGKSLLSSSFEDGGLVFKRT